MVLTEALNRVRKVGWSGLAVWEAGGPTVAFMGCLIYRDAAGTAVLTTETRKSIGAYASLKILDSLVEMAEAYPRERTINDTTR